MVLFMISKGNFYYVKPLKIELDEVNARMFFFANCHNRSEAELDEVKCTDEIMMIGFHG